MGIDILELAADTAKVQITYKDRVSQITYHPDVLTTAMAADFATAEEAGDLEAVTNLLEPLLADWDLTAGPGVPFPPVAENLRRVPLGLLGAIFGVIQKEITSGEADAPSQDG